MYECPITLNIADISSQIRETQDGRLIYEVQKAIGYDIDRVELIKALNYDRDQYQKGYEDGRKDNEWIPVSERLPEDRRTVLVTAYWHETYQVMEASYYGNGLWWCVPFNNCGEHMRKLKPKAWMPLPEPYKAESEDRK